MKTIGYIVLTWNSEKHIDACLNSIFKINNYKSKVVVIENGSTDNTVSILKKYESKYGTYLDIFYSDFNMGTTKSRNIGLKKLLGKVDYICVLDSDTIVNEEAITTLIDNLNNDKKIGIIGPKMITSSNIVQQSGRTFPTMKIKLLKACPIKKLQKIGEKLEKYDFSDDNTLYEVDYLMSACWMIREEVFKKVGKFDERIFYAPEDVDLCMRMHLKGYKIIFCPKAVIIHEWQRLSKKKMISKINYEHVKGLMYYFNKYHYLFNSKKAKNKEM